MKKIMCALIFLVSGHLYAETRLQFQKDGKYVQGQVFELSRASYLEVEVSKDTVEILASYSEETDGAKVVVSKAALGHVGLTAKELTDILLDNKASGRNYIITFNISSNPAIWTNDRGLRFGHEFRVNSIANVATTSFVVAK